MQNIQQANGLSIPLASFALAGLSGAATTHSHAASLPFSIGGVIGTSPSGTTTPVVNSSPTAYSSASGALAAGQPLSTTTFSSGFRAALVVWTINSAGTKKIRSKGFFSSPGSETLALEFPDIPVDELVVAYHTVKITSSLAATWTYGVSNWNATGVGAITVVNTIGTPSAGVVSVS